MQSMGDETKDSWTVKPRVAIISLTVLFLLLGFAPVSAATYLPPGPPTIKTMPILNANVIPVSAGHHWMKASTSSRIFVKCMVDYGVESKYNLRVQQFTNESPKSLAFIVYAADLTARPTDVADVLQTCLNGVDSPTELNVGGSSGDGANVGVNKGMRAYVTARNYFGLMIITYWAQMNAPLLNPLPTDAMADRAQVLYELAARGVTNPAVVNCKTPGASGFTTIPSQVRVLVRKLFPKSPAISIYKDQASVVDMKTESSVPHICINSWDRLEERRHGDWPLIPRIIKRAR